ncbi:MAG TPA: hypothetical protein VN223_03680 [Candidatus Elarobacter sp.]|nr:hypothetical protein [Candidatus Elarobacter sp.]
MKALLAVIVLCGAAFAQNDAAIATAKSACGPDKMHFDVEATDFSDSIAQPEAGKALIYVISDQPGTVARIGMDNAWVAALEGNTHLSFSVGPGEHHFCANWQSIFSARSKYVALSSLNAEAGKVYYLRIRFTIQGEHGPPLLDLDVINEDQGRYLVLGSRRSESHLHK